MIVSSKTVADLGIGEMGTISRLDDNEVSLKLLEMGCLPGCTVKLCRKAPFGGPVCVHISGYQLSLRKEEAATIILE